jgi:hypothetical protein
MASGQALTALCKTHILETMRALPECAPDGPGLGNKAIEDAANFGLGLPRADGWFTWSLLVALTLDGAVEALQSGKRNKKYRLAVGS